ncbi:MAG: response regulator transcription factor [Gemmataceae bacterium]
MRLPPTVLVVDGDAKDRQSLCDFLAGMGYRLAAVPDGPQGLEIVGRLLPDLIVCDVALPGKSGLSVLESVKAMPKPIPMIILASVGGPALRSLALLLGADAFFRKPVSMNRMLEVISRLCPPSVPDSHTGQLESTLANVGS